MIKYTNYNRRMQIAKSILIQVCVSKSQNAITRLQKSAIYIKIFYKKRGRCPISIYCLH